jgi:hypothetical protein
MVGAQRHKPLSPPGRQPLTGHGLEQLEFDVIVGRPNVLDVP